MGRSEGKGDGDGRRPGPGPVARDRVRQGGREHRGVRHRAQVDSVPYAMATDDDLRETVKMVEALDQRCVAVKADCRDTAAMNDAVATAISEFDRIDVLLVEHGLLSLSAVAQMSDEPGTTTSLGPDRGASAILAAVQRGWAVRGPRAASGDRVDGRPGSGRPRCASLRGEVGGHRVT